VFCADKIKPTESKWYSGRNAHNIISKYFILGASGIPIILYVCNMRDVGMLQIFHMGLLFFLKEFKSTLFSTVITRILL